MTSDTLINLLEQRAGQALGELDAAYGVYCRSIARNILKNEEDAEECVSDAYLAVWNAIPPARPDPLLPYLLKIVRNISVGAYWRRTAAKRDSRYTVSLQEIECCAAGAGEVEDAVDARELARSIEGFLDTLTAENRVLFLRRYWFADSCRDIAELVGLREKSVSVRLVRIRQKMRQYLLEKGVSL